MDLVDALDAAVDEFRRRLVGVVEAGWTGRTPCDGWDVRDLVAHVVGGHRFAALVLGGSPAQEAMDLVTSETVLGARPVEDHDRMAAAQRVAFRRPGALSAVVDHPAGPITGTRFLSMRVFDVAVHAWDLARATGADEQLDPQLAQKVLDVLRRMPDGPGFGIVPIGAATDADPAQVQLLDFSGRR